MKSGLNSFAGWIQYDGDKWLSVDLKINQIGHNLYMSAVIVDLKWTNVILVHLKIMNRMVF